jgi:hypothetical protein
MGSGLELQDPYRERAAVLGTSGNPTESSYTWYY